jgi:hypothetical protein
MSDIVDELNAVHRETGHRRIPDESAGATTAEAAAAVDNTTGFSGSD